MKYFILLGLGISLVSCKNSEQAFQSNTKIPITYESEAQMEYLDSARNKTFTNVPAYQVFFKDPLLVSLMDSVLANNLDLQIAYARIQQNRAGIAYTKGIRLPDFNAAASSGVRKFGDYTIDGVGNYDTQFSPNLTADQQIPNPVPDYFVGVYSSWEIDLWGKLKNKKRAALQRYLASEQGRNLVISELVATVANNYYSLVLLDREMKIIEESIQLQENALQIVQAQIESGKANALAFQMMRVQVLKSKNLQREVAHEIMRFENEMNLLLGRYPQSIIRGEYSTVTAALSNLSTGIPSQLLQKRPDILQAEYQLNAAKADLKSAKAAFYPTLQLTGSLGLQAFRFSVLLDSPSSFAFNLANGLVMPLLNRRALKAELMDTKGKQLEAYLNYEKTVQNAFSEVYALLRFDDNLEKMEQIKTEELKMVNESINTVNDLYQSGKSTYLEIITAQEYYLEAQIETLHVQLRKFNNQIHLYKALGGGI
jgi:NodT family efflux transporter outer membrane factor (OMF) lipoprotein